MNSFHGFFRAQQGLVIGGNPTSSFKHGSNPLISPVTCWAAESAGHPGFRHPTPDLQNPLGFTMTHSRGKQGNERIKE